MGYAVHQYEIILSPSGPWRILMASNCGPTRRTGKLASCKVTIPGLINNYHVIVSVLVGD